MILLTDKHNNANLIDYAMIKFRLVVYSEFGGISFELEETHNPLTIIRHDLKHNLEIQLKTKILYESSRLFNSMIANAPTM